MVVSTGEIDDVGAGDARSLNLVVNVGDPGDLTVAVGGLEIDTLSADDALGRVSRTFERDDLCAIADTGPALIGMPVLLGDGGEYVLDITVQVDSATG